MLVKLIAGLLIVATVASGDEPKSQFEYESQILERLVRMQVRMEALESSLAQTNKNFESLLINTTQVLDNRTTQLENLREQVNMPVVAFHAYDPSDYSLDTNQILILTTVALNEGDGYDNVIGVFTAPVGGLYFFAAHVCNYASLGGFYYEIVKDHTMIAKSAKYNSVNSDCGSVTVIVRMNKDERVWIKCTSGNSNTQLYTSTYKTSFLGLLMHK